MRRGFSLPTAPLCLQALSKPIITLEKPEKKTNRSRYDEDFDEIEKLGKGAYGSVYKVQNKLDGLYYALKRINFRNTSSQLLEKVLREVKTLALLNHPNIVRYHSAWLEEDDSLLPISENINPNNHANSNYTHKVINDSKHNGVDLSTASEWSDCEDDTTTNNSISFSSCTYSTQNNDDSMEQFNPFKFDEDSQVLQDFFNGKDLLPIPENMDTISINDTIPFNNINSNSGQSPKTARFIPSPININTPKSIARKNSMTSVTTLFIVMQLYSTTLAQWLELRPDASHVDPRQNIHIFKQICKGLQYIHSRGVIHRDLKPGNIFLSRVEDGAISVSDVRMGKGEYLVCLGDFGLAIQNGSPPAPISPTGSPLRTSASSMLFPIPTGGSGSSDGSGSGSGSAPMSISSSSSSSSSSSASGSFPSLVDSGGSYSPRLSMMDPSSASSASSLGKSWEMKKHTSAVGTLTYSSPEQRYKGVYNEKTDIYSLGIIFFELYYPCSTKMEKARVLADLRNRILPPHFLQKYPSESAFILWLMSPNPDDRPSVDEILRHDLLVDDFMVVPRKDLQEFQKMLQQQQATIQQQQDYIRMLEQKLAFCGNFTEISAKNIGIGVSIDG